MSKDVISHFFGHLNLQSKESTPSILAGRPSVYAGFRAIVEGNCDLAKVPVIQWSLTHALCEERQPRDAPLDRQTSGPTWR